jgi:hypothetical protein
MMFEMAPLSTDFGMCVVWFLEEVGFTPEEIQDALTWYYGGQGAPIEEAVDIAILRRMQEMCNAVFEVRGWKKPFPDVQVH